MTGHDEKRHVHIQKLRRLGAALDEFLNGPKGNPRNFGFVMLTFELGETVTAESDYGYISNADREDVLAGLKEFIARTEGRMSEEVGHA